MKILRIKDVTETTGFCRSQIYSLMETGAFPQSIKLGVRSVGWVDTEVENWIKSKVVARDLQCPSGQAATVG